MSTGRLLLLLSAIFLLVLGLGAGPACDTSSQVDMPLYGAGGVFPDDDSDDDTPSDTTPPDAPIVDDVVTPTALAYQSVRGSAEPLTVVKVSGGLNDTETEVDESGQFGVKVALKTDQVNKLVFVAVDEAGNVSEATHANIEQQSEPPNYAESGTASASSVSYTKPENTPDKAIDGNYLSWWENTTQTWHPEALYQPQWLAVKMAKDYWIETVNVFWGRDLLGKYEYGTLFDVYVNTEDEPEVMPHEVDPSELGEYGYVQVGHVVQDTDEDIQNNLFDLTDDPRQCRWVFLALWESNAPSPLTTAYSFEVAELEIYGYERADEGCE